jgi:thiol-disulfide isomerase/thioredoxin
MKQNTLMIAALVGVSSLALLGAGCAPSDSSSDSMMQNDAMMKGEEMNMEKDAMMESDGSMKKMIGEEEKDKDMIKKEGDTMMKDDSMMMQDDSAMMMKKAGMYETYSESKLAMAETGDVVLFFHASWCPTCKAANDDIMARVASIPSDLTILKVDYDSATDLRKKYGVTMQHTFVQVNSKGEMLKKWTGGNTLDAITKQVQ